MKFSVIMPSYLGDYPHAAQGREAKIVRAWSSLLKQTYQDFELIVVADGCEKTCDIFLDYAKDERMKCYLIPKQKTWSGEPRNEGIRRAKGQYIIYLDIDDVFGVNHLAKVASGLKEYDWVFFNDITNKLGQWVERGCELVFSKCGTSNFCHKRELGELWRTTTYRHDWYFVKELLRKSRNYGRTDAEYFVCHIPRRYDI